MSKSIFEQRLEQLAAPYVETEAFKIFGPKTFEESKSLSLNNLSNYVMKYENAPLNK